MNMINSIKVPAYCYILHNITLCFSVLHILPSLEYQNDDYGNSSLFLLIGNEVVLVFHYYNNSVRLFFLRSVDFN